MCLPSPLGLIDITTWEKAHRKHGKGRDLKKNKKKEKEWDKFFGLQRANQVSSLLFGKSERLPIGATLAIATISLSSKDADLIDPTVLKCSNFHKKNMFLAFLFKGTATFKIISVQNDYIGWSIKSVPLLVARCLKSSTNTHGKIHLNDM